MGCHKSKYIRKDPIDVTCEVENCVEPTYGDSILCQFHYMEVMSQRLDKFDETMESLFIDVKKILETVQKIKPV